MTKIRRGATRDYRKKRTVSLATHFPIGWITLLLGILIGVFISIWVMKHISNYSSPKKSLSSVEKKRKSTRIENSKHTQGTRFEFYSLLTNKEKTKKPTLSLKTPIQTSRIKNLETNQSYHIQIEGFSTKIQADALRAKLALNGIQTHIHPVKLGSGKQAYTLRLGPFNSYQQAKASEKQLKRFQFTHPLMIKHTK